MLPPSDFSSVAVIDSLTKALEAGIPVVCFDTGVDNAPEGSVIGPRCWIFNAVASWFTSPILTFASAVAAFTFSSITGNSKVRTWRVR